MQIRQHTKSVINCIEQGLIGQALSETFFPNGKPAPRESALWDYKEKVDPDKISMAETAKDVLAFYNSYGGYLIIGVSETKRDEEFSIVGFKRPEKFSEELRSTIESYVSVRIEVSVSDILVGEQAVVAILIPRRSSHQPPAFVVRNGPEKRSGKIIFKEKSTFFRQYDQSLCATIASQWEFLNSARNPEELIGSGLPLSASAVLSRVVPNNLPNRSLICPHLFGREDIIASLWAWIADELEPVRLLAGAGGKGKTSIAYEFASGFFRNAPEPYLQVLWISAKRFQFRPDRNEYLELPECSYTSPIDLLRSLCIGTAALRHDEASSSDETEYTLQKKLRESLRLVPSFIIIDDVDSLEQMQQKRVFELVHQISAGAPSKFLLTTRANFAFSDSQCIQVLGLEGEPYSSFVSDRVLKLRLPALRRAQIKELQAASGGSPMWTESILRLLKQGHRFGEALKEWKQKPGEDARVAALGKEIAGLSNGARRVLFVASLLRECSRAELISITSFGNTELDQAVNELQILFLVDAPKIIENEPRFSVAESTALAMKECADNFVRDHKKLTAAVRYFRSQVSSDAGAGARKKVAHVVTQTVALLGTEQFDKAMETVDAALATSPDHPDLLMLRGRCLRSTQPAEALVEFESAFNVGQRKPILFDMWYQASIDRSAFSTSISVCERAVASELDRSIWLPRRARALVQVAFRHYRDGNVARSLATLRSSIDDLANAIEAVSGSVKQAAVYRRDLASVVDTALSISAVETSLEIILARFDLLCDAIHRGDRRAENAGRVVGLVEALVSGVDFEAASGVERASRVRIHDGIKALTAARQCLTVASEDYQVFDLSIERLERLIPNSRA